MKYTSTLKRSEDARQSMLQLAGSLFTLNVNIDIVAVNAVDGTRGLVHGILSTELPPYQYTYGPILYHEGRASMEFRHRDRIRHDTLGSRVVGTAALKPQWCNFLRIKDLAWLGDHRLLSDAVFPAAGYLTIAMEAAQSFTSEWSGHGDVEQIWLRDVSFKAGLQIPEDDFGIEINTSMTIVDSTSDGHPEWMSFAIASFKRESTQWTEHCTGYVKCSVTKKFLGSRLQSMGTNPERLNARAWYRKFSAIGLRYGPTFQSLSDIQVDSAHGLASATVALNTTANQITGGESEYAIHPASLDGAIQLGIIASYNGRIAEADTAYVPVRLAQLYIDTRLQTSAGAIVARGERRGLRSNHIDFHMMDADGQIVLQASELKCTSYATSVKSEARAFSAPLTRLVWRPDLRQMNGPQLRSFFRPPADSIAKAPLWALTNQMAFLVVYSIYEEFATLRDGPSPSGDVGHFFAWVKRRCLHDRSEAMNNVRQLTREQRLQSIEELTRHAPEVIEIRIAKLLHDNMSDILYERRTGVDVILSEQLLTPLYQTGLLMTGIYPQLHAVLDLLGHANPNMRILEIGGGTGGATRIAANAWLGAGGIKKYHDYTFTDISPGFLSSAREALSEYPDFHYSVFDAEVEPSAQGFEDGAYDLIIACQVLHATSNMRRTLTNVRRLLRPGGQLVLVETTQNFMVPGVVVGTFTGYWAGIPDGRIDAPFMTLLSWDKALREAGFSGNDLVLDDFPHPHNTTSVIVSTATSEESPTCPASIFLLYAADDVPALLIQVAQELENRAIKTKILPFDQASIGVPPSAHVVTFLSDGHLLVDDCAGDLRSLQDLCPRAVRMTVVTSCSITRGQNPNGAIIAGLLRVLRTENPVAEFFSLDIDAKDFKIDDGETGALVRSIANCHLGFDKELRSIDRKDQEFVWQDGCLWISRLVPDTRGNEILSRELSIQTGPLERSNPVRARFEVPGVPGSLYFEPYKELLSPLPRDCIDVRVLAVGLSPRNVDSWFGRSDENHLSSEYSGIVTAVGSNVQNLNVGDQVFGVGKGQFGNYARVPAALAGKAGPLDDMLQLASMPMAFMTAIYAVEYVSRIKAGSSVLIESATTDLGLALTQLLRVKDAKIFASVESVEHADFLVKKYDMSRERISLSRSAPHCQQQTPCYDVVFATSNVSGFSPSSGCLSRSGHLIHFGRTNSPHAGLISHDSFGQCAHLSTIDPMDFLDPDWELGSELIRQIRVYLDQNVIGPIQPTTVVPVGKLSAPLGDLINRRLIGKLVASFEDPSIPVRLSVPPPSVSFDPEAVYVITGGLGGMGRSVVRWMGDRGARHIALLSRRPIDAIPESQRLIDSLVANGINVMPLSCDISDVHQLIDVLSTLAAKRPIKGIMHAAVAYEDLSFEKTEPLKWQKGLAAKVNGTWNLHHATLSHKLDFFVMPTTIVSFLALPTQGAYVAANNFQEYFARYRRRQGLPSSTVAFSLINNITNVGSRLSTIDTFERNRALTLFEHQFLALLEPAFYPTPQMNSVEPWDGALQDPLSGANLFTCLDPAAMKDQQLDMERTSTQTPRWYDDMRVSIILRALADALIYSKSDNADVNGAADKTQNGVASAAHVKRCFDEILAGGGEKQSTAAAYVADSIAAAVAEIMFVDEEEVDPSKSIADQGVDSLIAAELRNWFMRALSTDVSMLDLLDPGVTILAMGEKIVSQKLG